MTDTTVVTSDDEFLTRDQVCEALNISKRQLWQLEKDGNGPPRMSLGTTIRYPKSLLPKYLSDRVQVG